MHYGDSLHSLKRKPRYTEKESRSRRKERTSFYLDTMKRLLIDLPRNTAPIKVICLQPLCGLIPKECSRRQVKGALVGERLESKSFHGETQFRGDVKRKCIRTETQTHGQIFAVQ